MNSSRSFDPWKYSNNNDMILTTYVYKMVDDKTSSQLSIAWPIQV